MVWINRTETMMHLHGRKRYIECLARAILNYSGILALTSDNNIGNNSFFRAKTVGICNENFNHINLQKKGLIKWPTLMICSFCLGVINSSVFISSRLRKCLKQTSPHLKTDTPLTLSPSRLPILLKKQMQKDKNSNPCIKVKPDFRRSACGILENKAGTETLSIGPPVMGKVFLFFQNTILKVLHEIFNIVKGKIHKSCKSLF